MSPPSVSMQYVQCVALIFLWSFKPSEPHLSAYLKDVKHLTKYQRDAEVYTVYTYGSLVVVSIAAILKVYALQFPNFQGLGDRALIRLGCAARLSTRLLLLFGDSVRSMQLMQVAFAVGLVGELAFWAYCLKAVPSHAQQLTAVAQAAYLVAHTFAGLLGDWLLQLTDIGLTGLMWISFASVGLSCLVALSLPPVDVGGGSIPVDRVPWFQAFSRVYRSPRRFWLSTLWWVCSYPAYQTIYGYESSLYADRFGDRTDHNGTIFAVALLCGAGASLLLSWDPLQRSASRRPISVFLVVSTLAQKATERLKSPELPAGLTHPFLDTNLATCDVHDVLRCHVAQALQRRDGVETSMEELVLVDHTKEAFELAFQCSRGLNQRPVVLVPAPSLTSCLDAALNLAEVTPYFLEESRHWDVLPEALEKASGARPPTPSVLVLQNPGLPGQVLSATSIRSSLEFAARHEMLVVAQEDVSLLFEEGRFRSCRRMVKEMDLDLPLITICSPEDVAEATTFSTAPAALHMHNVKPVQQVRKSTDGRLPREAWIASVLSAPLEDSQRKLRAVLSQSTRNARERLETVAGISCEAVEAGMYVFPKDLLGRLRGKKGQMLAPPIFLLAGGIAWQRYINIGSGRLRNWPLDWMLRWSSRAT
ncbi:unnamed protein product [Durusdinium trenchii]|uniref:Aminotransferase class I/classII large domain-containing protein n=1 Tax=Durusdinium trenchii TaxID=1381693 RepID=A0ABP0HNS6_9DINO